MTAPPPRMAPGCHAGAAAYVRRRRRPPLLTAVALAAASLPDAAADRPWREPPRPWREAATEDNSPPIGESLHGLHEMVTDLLPVAQQAHDKVVDQSGHKNPIAEAIKNWAAKVKEVGDAAEGIKETAKRMLEAMKAPTKNMEEQSHDKVQPSLAKIAVAQQEYEADKAAKEAAGQEEVAPTELDNSEGDSQRIKDAETELVKKAKASPRKVDVFDLWTRPGTDQPSPRWSSDWDGCPEGYAKIDDADLCKETAKANVDKFGLTMVDENWGHGFVTGRGQDFWPHGCVVNKESNRAYFSNAPRPNGQTLKFKFAKGFKVICQSDA